MACSKMPITDKMVKKGCLSVKLNVSILFLRTNAPKMDFVRNPHHNAQKFSGQIIKKAGLSVKWFWDKSMKICHLSVNPDEILAELGEQRHFFKKIVFFAWKIKNAGQSQS